MTNDVISLLLYSVNRLDIERRRLKQEIKRIEDRKKHHTSPALFSQEAPAVPNPAPTVRHTVFGGLSTNPHQVISQNYEPAVPVAPADMPLIDFS